MNIYNKYYDRLPVINTTNNQFMNFNFITKSNLKCFLNKDVIYRVKMKDSILECYGKVVYVDFKKIIFNYFEVITEYFVKNIKDIKSIEVNDKKYKQSFVGKICSITNYKDENIICRVLRIDTNNEYDDEIEFEYKIKDDNKYIILVATYPKYLVKKLEKVKCIINECSKLL